MLVTNLYSLNMEGGPNSRLLLGRESNMSYLAHLVCYWCQYREGIIFRKLTFQHSFNHVSLRALLKQKTAAVMF